MEADQQASTQRAQSAVRNHRAADNVVQLGLSLVGQRARQQAAGGAHGAAEHLEELLPLDRVRNMTGMGTTFNYGEIKPGRFPRSIRIGRRALWIQSEVQRWGG